ncbi:MAG: DUF2149 domain-containing protein [Desulfobacterales bacterium]|nr:DUF2149 domain-containing protein [Desulfobacterales bacterium]
MVTPHYRTRRSRRKRALSQSDADDPMSGVANLFDVAMVFAVALILGIFHVLNIPELLMGADDVTIIKNPGKANMEIIQKNGKKMEKYTMTREDAGGNGRRLGVCYRLEGGQMVYVPEPPGTAGASHTDN